MLVKLCFYKSKYFLFYIFEKKIEIITLKHHCVQLFSLLFKRSQNLIAEFSSYKTQCVLHTRFHT